MTQFVFVEFKCCLGRKYAYQIHCGSNLLAGIHRVSEQVTKQKLAGQYSKNYISSNTFIYTVERCNKKVCQRLTQECSNREHQQSLAMGLLMQ